MKAISQGGNTYDIFDDSLRVYDQLPAQSYVVRFSEKRGFYLSKYVEMEITESKVYGAHGEKVNKVLASFAEMNRSLGVILSGGKGIGKSMFAKMLASAAIRSNIPVIVVDKYFAGVASYIEGIEQNVMILFDEFDKTFGEIKAEEGESSPQTQLLTLFDGLSGGKKLFVVTCNEIRKLNEYLINRPGRFHYHFRFDYPSADDIREYLKDKLNENYYCEIDSVVAFSSKVSLNYDCLRSIAFELNHGLSFAEAIKDLNIINTQEETYRVTLRYTNGVFATNKNARLDLFGDDDESSTVYLYDKSGEDGLYVTFMPSKIAYDTHTGGYFVRAQDLTLNYDDDDSDFVKSVKGIRAECLTISLSAGRNIHYAV